jgi:hypothetical protein
MMPSLFLQQVFARRLVGERLTLFPFWFFNDAKIWAISAFAGPAAIVSVVR